MENTQPEISNTSPRRLSIFKIIAIVSVTILLVCIGILIYKNQQLVNQLADLSAKSETEIDINQWYSDELADKKWLSPSGKNYLTYKHALSDNEEYQLILVNEKRNLRLGRLYETLYDLRISWSPNEKYVLVSKADDISRIFCVDLEDSECIGEVSFYTLSPVSILWSDEETAYVIYTEKGKNIVSQLSFSNSIYPEEKIIFEADADPFFALSPKSISPSKQYLALQQFYEWAPHLEIMDTRNGRIVIPEEDGQSYVLASDPNFRWDGNQLTFLGGTIQGGDLSSLQNDAGQLDDSLMRDITIEVSSLF